MNKIRKYALKTIAVTIAAVLLTGTAVNAADLPDIAGDAAPIITDPVDVFLAQSAFVGNSVGEGLTMYNNAKGKVPLGNATMLTRVSYSFLNDANRSTKFIPVFNGQAMQAKDAIKLCGARYVFICMGTNDLVGSSSVEKAVERYKQYLAGIIAENPAVTIFIESCTPTRPGSNVNNEKITQFNLYMQMYCDLVPNMYYVDISTPLKDATGYLSASLSSDGSVHLTNKAYALWAQTIRQYIANFLAVQAAQLHARTEMERQAARKNYEANMKEMEQKKQKEFEIRLAAKREAQAAEEKKRRDALLNVPNEATLLQTLTADNAADTSAPVRIIARSTDRILPLR